MNEVPSTMACVFSYPAYRFSDGRHGFKSCLFHADVVHELARFKTMTALGLWEAFYCSSYKSVYYFLRSVQDRLGLSDRVVSGEVFLEKEDIDDGE